MQGSGKVVRSVRQQRFAAKYGPWAVVTGASDGIGREIACRLAEAGLNVMLVARRRQPMDTLAAELGAGHGVQTRVVAADLGSAGEVAAVLQAARDLDVGLLVAAAGFGSSGAFVDGVAEVEANMIDVNCRAVAVMAQHFAQRFVARRRGGLVLMSSLVAFQGVPRAANYAATKAYVQALAEALAVELKPSGVDVVAAAPGPVRSGFGGRADMKMGISLAPKDVAQSTLDGLGRRVTVRPGWLSKLLEASLLPLPRWGRVRMMGVVMGGMTNHQAAAKEDRARSAA